MLIQVEGGEVGRRFTLVPGSAFETWPIGSEVGSVIGSDVFARHVARVCRGSS